MRSAIAFLVPLTLLAGATAPGAQGGDPSVIYACVHKDPRDGEVHGQVRIVLPGEGCRRNEAPMHWSVRGPAGPPGPQGPAGPPGPAGSGLQVVDSVGNIVGSVTGVMFDGPDQVLPQVVLTRDGVTFALLVTPSGFEGTGQSLAFALMNCQGTAFLNSTPTLILPGTIDVPGHTVYVPDTSVTPARVTAQSVAEAGTCFTFPFTLPSAVPARALVDLDTLFTSPFSLR